jgi:hypothetical protein
VQKAKNVQKAGASALIVMNNENCCFLLMQGNTTEVRIPVLTIPQKDAKLIVALLAANLSTSLEISGPVNYPSEKWEHMEDWSSGGLPVVSAARGRQGCMPLFFTPNMPYIEFIWTLYASCLQLKTAALK